jgi:flavin-dependent dehydrogenase
MSAVTIAAEMRVPEENALAYLKKMPGAFRFGRQYRILREHFEDWLAARIEEHRKEVSDCTRRDSLREVDHAPGVLRDVLGGEALADAEEDEADELAPLLLREARPDVLPLRGGARSSA